MELKAYKGDIYVPMYGSIADAKVYLKSEADKVIAELNAQKAQAEDDCAYWKTKAQRERHQKYKQCLDKAKICELDMEQWVEGSLKWQRRKNWHNRWLALAEKFKEAE